MLISLLGGAFKMMKNRVYSILIASLFAESFKMLIYENYMNLRGQSLPEMNGVSGVSSFSFPLPFPGEKKANNRIICRG